MKKFFENPYPHGRGVPSQNDNDKYTFTIYKLYEQIFISSDGLEPPTYGLWNRQAVLLHPDMQLWKYRLLSQVSGMDNS